MCWSCVVPLYVVNYNRAYIDRDSEPVINYMILCDATQYVIPWDRLVTTAQKLGGRLLTFCSSLSTPCVLHNPCACSQLSYQQAFTLGTSQFRVSLSPGYIFIWILLRLHYNESHNYVQVQNLKGYKLDYNWLYVRPPHAISTSRYNCNPSNKIKDWTLLFVMEVHFIVSFYITITLNVTMTIFTTW